MRTRSVVYGAVALLVIVAAVVAVLYVRKEPYLLPPMRITPAPGADEYEWFCADQCKAIRDTDCLNACRTKHFNRDCVFGCTVQGFKPNKNCILGCVTKSMPTTMYSNDAPYPHMEAGPSYVSV